MEAQRDCWARLQASILLTLPDLVCRKNNLIIASAVGQIETDKNAMKTLDKCEAFIQKRIKTLEEIK